MIFQEREESADPIDLQGIQEVITGKRHATLLWKSGDARKLAAEHQLELIELPPSLESPSEELARTRSRYLIGKHESAKDAILTHLPHFNIPAEASEKIAALGGQIENMSVTEALQFLYAQAPFRGAMETPEVAALEGLLYGYKPCDVEYYLQTRYFGKTRHPNEEADFDILGYVACERCTQTSLANQTPKA